MKRIIFAVLFSVLVAAGVALSDYFPDVIVTSPSGIWTDTRAYTTIDDAISAIGANDRDIYIAREEATTALTIPANASLHFFNDGSIANSGQLTINTTDIRAPNRQIFTGSGNIDFANGTIVKSGWFSNVETAFALTVNDAVTLIISKAQTITGSFSPGDDVTLKWESPGNILTVNAGIVVGNLNNLEAGNYQIFAGPGDFDFLDGTVLNLSWFPYLRSVINWVENESVTLVIDRPSDIDYSDTIPSNLTISIKNGGLLTLSPGTSTVFNCPLDIGLYKVFTGTGTVTLGPLISRAYPEWWGVDGTDDQVEILKANEALSDGTIVLSKKGNYAIDDDLTLTKPLNIYEESICNVAAAKTLTINGTFKAGICEIFAGSGTVSLGSGSTDIVYPQWFGAVGDGVTDDYAAINTAISAALGRTLKFPFAGTYMVSAKLTLPATNIFIDAVPGVWLKASAVMDYIIGNTDPAYATQQLRINNLWFDGDSKAVNCIYLYKLSFQNHDALNGVYVTGATDDGILLQACQGGSFRGIRADTNSGNGVAIQGCNSASFYSITARYNSLAGIEVTDFNDGVQYSGGCFLYRSLCEQNTQHGMVITDVDSMVLVSGGWFEANGATYDGINITDSRVTIHGARISGEGDGSNAAIHITSGGGVIATGNMLQRSAGDTSYPNVLDDSGTEVNVVSPNYTYLGGLIANHPWLKADEINSLAIIGDGSSGAQGDLGGGTAVAAAATGGTDTFIMTVETTAGSVVALEVELIGEFGGLHDKGVYKKFIFYAGVGTSVVYDASTTEHLTLGDADKADITAGNPTAVGGQSHFTVTFTNANAAAFTGFVRVVSYSTLQVTYSVANNQ